MLNAKKRLDDGLVILLILRFVGFEFKKQWVETYLLTCKKNTKSNIYSIFESNQAICPYGIK